MMCVYHTKTTVWNANNEVNQPAGFFPLCAKLWVERVLLFLKLTTIFAFLAM